MSETKIKLSIDGVQQVVGGMKQVGETVKDVSGSLAALSAVGGALSLGALAAMVKSSIDAADNLNDLSKTTQVSVENLAGLRLATQQTGTDLEATAKAINTLTVNMGKDAEKFAKLGISARDPIEAFKQLADIANAVQDPQQKNALLAEALGKSWQSVAPLISEGSAKIGEMVEQGQRLSGITQDMANQSDQFNDSLAVLDASMDGFRNRLAIDILPLLNVLAEDLAGTAEKTAELDGVFNPLTETLRALVVVGGNVAFVFKGIGTEIGGMAAQIAALATLDVQGFLAIGEMMKSDAKSAREAFDAWEKRVMEAGPKVTQQAQTVDDELQRIRGRSDAANAARVRAFIEGEAAAKKAASEAKKELQERAKLLAELSGVNGDYMEQLSRLDAIRKAGNISQARYVELVTALIAKQPAAKKFMDEQKKAMEDAEKATLDAASARVKYIATLGDGLKKIQDDIKAQQEHNERIGLSAVSIAHLDAAKLEDQATTLEGLAIKKLDKDVDIEQYEVLKQQAAALRELADLKRQGAVKEAYATEMRDAAQEAKRSFEELSQSLTDNIMRGGKSGLDYIKDYARTLVLRPFVQMAVNPIAGAISGAFGGGGGAMGGIAQGASIVNAGSTIWGAMSGGLTSSIGGFTAGMGNYLGLTGMTEFGVGMQGATLASGLAGPTTAGAGGAMGAGAAFAQAVPYLAAAYAIYSIVKSFDDSGTIHTGGAARAGYGGNRTIDARELGFMRIDTTGDAEKMASGIASGIVSILDATATTFGQAAGYSAATAFADDTSEDGAWGALRIERNGQTVLDWDANRQSRWAPREYGDGEAGRNQYLADLSGSVRDALDQIGLPGWAQTMLDQLGDAPTIEQLGATVEKINATQHALVTIGDTIEGFVGLSDEAVTALINATGGVEVFSAGLSAFYDGYYTEAEKIDNLSTQVRDALEKVGLEMPATREEFRALVEEQIALGETGAPAVATLLRVSEAFGMVADYAEKTATTVTTVAQATSTLDASLTTWRESQDRAYTASLAAEEKRRDDQQRAQRDMAESLASAFQNVTDGMRDTIGTFRQFQKSLTEFQQSLYIGDLSPLSPGQQYEALRGRLQGYAARANSGDQEAYSLLQGEARTFLQASKSFNASGAGFVADFDWVQGLIGGAVQAADGHIEEIQESIAEAWRSYAEMMARRADGSHADGLDFVPFDGYRAVLHRGEKVLTAEEARSERSASGAAVATEVRRQNDAIDRQNQLIERLINAVELGRVDNNDGLRSLKQHLSFAITKAVTA